MNVTAEQRRRATLLVPLVLATVASQSSMASLAPLFVEIGDDFDHAVGTVGQVRSVSAGCAVVATFLVGHLIDRFGVRAVLAGGGLITVAAALASASAPSFTALVAAQAFGGAGIACLLSGGFAGASEFFPGDARNWAIGWIVGLQSIAWIVGIPLVGLLADAISWRASLVGVPATFALAALISALIFAPRGPAVDGDADGPVGLTAALADPGARRWTLAELLAFATWTAEITYIGAFYIQTYGLSETMVGVLLPTGSITFLIGSALTERLARRRRRATLLNGTALAMGGIAAILFNFAPAVVVTMLLGATMGVVSGVRAASSSTLALDQLPERAGAMMAARTAAAQLGYMIGAATGGFAVTIGGYGSLGAIMVVGMSASAFVMSRVPDPHPEPHSDRRVLPAIVD